MLLETTQRSYLQHLQITVIDSEKVTIIMCVKISVFFTIRYIYDDMKLSEKNFNVFSVFNLQHLLKTLLDNKHVALILFLKNKNSFSVRCTYDKMKHSENMSVNSTF